ncbi:MAG: hypothetical protein WD007_00360 [Nitriliruptoraceae bacterium]
MRQPADDAADPVISGRRVESSTIAVGPPALGLTMSAAATVRDGWLVRHLEVPGGLDGPEGILQGGLSSAALIGAAQAADPIGAPVTAVDARLHAPTPTGRTIEIAVRSTNLTAVYDVRTSHASTTLVTGTVELAGPDSSSHVHDLAEIAARALPTPQPASAFRDCWMCGSTNAHPYAQRMFPGYVDDRTVLCGWVADEVLGDDQGVVDPVLVAAALDCPTGWACAPTIEAMNTQGPLLGGYRVRYLRDVPVMEPVRIVGRLDHADGRKLSTRGALIDDDGTVCAVAWALQVAVDEIPVVVS